jgi:hypothetical protein
MKSLASEFYYMPASMVRELRARGIPEEEIKKIDLKQRNDIVQLFRDHNVVDTDPVFNSRSRSSLFYDLAHEYEKALPKLQREEDAHRFLSAHPELSMMAFADGSTPLDVVSKFPLGTEFVTDVVVLGVRSEGIPYHVILVELESPLARPFTKANVASKVLNRAQKQILEWDNWLRMHADEFCISLPNHLTRYAPKDLAINLRSAFLSFKIVIGRREYLAPKDLEARASILQMSHGRMEIMSYDRILSRAFALAGEKIR